MGFNFNDLIIFEMANNHQGSLDHGLHIIDQMAKIAQRYEIRAAVKLQYRDLDTFIHEDFKDRQDLKHIPRFMNTRMTKEQMHTLVMATKEHGMLSVVTPFDEISVDRCLNHGVDILKVASCSCMDWPLLEEVTKAGKPVICSTGGCRLGDIDKIVSFFEHRETDFALMHCVGIYPTENSDQQLQFMHRMIKRYPKTVIGYSGHESPDNLHIGPAALVMGAKIQERHVGVPTDTIKLNKYSMNPDQVCVWIESIQAAHQMYGQDGADKRITQTESDSLASLARGVWAKESVEEGQVLTPDKVFFAMPIQENQTTTKEYLETMVASRNYELNTPICERRTIDPILILRSVLHEVKGLLREAQIPVDSAYEMELSHHYGMENFRRYGATIISFINREYCKKLIILLPGQDHPSHLHKKKEETFQVLYGELDLNIDGTKKKLYPGEMHLVERDVPHAFSTQTGCIFEEISTTHIKGDSYYKDPKIALMDLVKRKTTLDEF